MNDANFPMHVSIVVTSAAQLTSVYALLGGAAALAVRTSGEDTIRKPIAQVAEPQPEREPVKAEAEQPAADAGEVDAGGHPWSAELHASTKGKTKDGYWRMKVGVSRPAPLPGFPKGETAPAGGTGTTSNGGASAAGATATNAAAGPATGEDEDEFAAFRAAAERANATDTAAAAAVPARKWSDADLGALCNQAAVKLGDPAPVKALIATHVPEGQVPHSRNIPEANRETFAQAVEKAAGITFTG